MQSVSSRIWTCVIVSISYDDNHYTTGTSSHFIVIGDNSVKCNVCQQNLDCANCIPPVEEVRPPPLQKLGVIGMIPKCIWWWGSISGDLRSVEYPFFAITPRSTLTWSGSTYKFPIYGSNRSAKKLFIFGRNTL